MKDEINFIKEEKKEILNKIKNIENSNIKYKCINNNLLSEYNKRNNEYLFLLRQLKEYDLNSNYDLSNQLESEEKKLISSLEDEIQRLENKLIELNQKNVKNKKENIIDKKEKEIELLKNQIEKENHNKELRKGEIENLKMQISKFENYINRSISNFNNLKEQISQFIDIEEKYNSIKAKRIIKEINLKSNISKFKQLIN